jgi:hypothetical protein
VFHHVRADGNLKLANLRSDSQTMESLKNTLAAAIQIRVGLQKKIAEHEAAVHESPATHS